ncbi:AraC family transcriptional regulator [Kribbella italica]|uniref:AraC family transcriptional activator of mtrCDE n=1 Tax=Kribbella italica TaxID=1540520 RepID=A0A7W9J2E9_9ACTN|nr:AraC family transcriptional regulator [Kribbella italica]MBB5833638.1 AraC family transcriptional activator of mtrCDE [Kribbella italica]
MDSISHLLKLADLQATLDKRCLLAEATEMKVPAYGETDATFHLLLDGECTFETPSGSFPLRAGEAVILPGSPPHFVRTNGRFAQQTSELDSSTPDKYGPPIGGRYLIGGGGHRLAEPLSGVVDTSGPAFGTLRSQGGGEAVIDLFCGYYTPGSAAGVMLFRSLPDPLIVSVADDEAAIRALCTMMRSEASSPGPGAGAILTSLCEALLAMVLRRSAGELTPGPLWTAVEDPRIADAIDAVLREPGADWSVERLAQVASMSRATFVRHFGKHTGTTVNALVTRIRMMVAADLLGRGELTVATVAAEVGYQSESAFSRAFQQASGSTPGRFRRLGRTP